MNQFDLPVNFYNHGNFYNYNNQPIPSAPYLEDDIPLSPLQPDPVYPQNYQQPILGYYPVYPNYQLQYQPQYPYQQQQYVVPSPPPKPALTRTIHEETTKLLAKASELSSEAAPKLSRDNSYNQVQAVLPTMKKPAASIAPVINFDFSDKHWDMFNNKTEVHHHHYQNGTGKNSEKKDDNGTRLLVGVIGFTITLATAFFAGKAIAKGEDETEQEAGFNQLKERWSLNKVCYEQDYQSTLEEVVSKADAILQRKQTNRTHKIALLALAFVAGGAGVGGALMSSTAVMTGAVALGAVVSVATSFKLGYAYFSTRDKKDAEAIEKGLAELSRKNLVMVG